MKKPNTRWECQAPERPAPGSRRPARRSILPATSSRQEGHQQSPAMCAPGARRARPDVLSPHPADQAPVPRQRPRRPRWSLYTAGSRFRRRPIIPSIGARRSGTAIRGSFPGEHGRQAPWSVRPGRGPGPRARGDSGRNRSRKQTCAASGRFRDDGGTPAGAPRLQSVAESPQLFGPAPFRDRRDPHDRVHNGQAAPGSARQQPHQLCHRAGRPSGG